MQQDIAKWLVNFPASPVQCTIQQLHLIYHNKPFQVEQLKSLLLLSMKDSSHSICNALMQTELFSPQKNEQVVSSNILLRWFMTAWPAKKLNRWFQEIFYDIDLWRDGEAHLIQPRLALYKAQERLVEAVLKLIHHV